MLLADWGAPTSPTSPTATPTARLPMPPTPAVTATLPFAMFPKSTVGGTGATAATSTAFLPFAAITLRRLVLMMPTATPAVSTARGTAPGTDFGSTARFRIRGTRFGRR